ncbi:TetR/AcrR family transcriptional regulator [Granulicella cerasi]|uniref:TetR/AcrR family transcriptional regulator n=1 Tax=Granulicella cerasi TaxID=741063 RepID=A0ABW1ZC66_9BACT|nr:TetR/AcrR family transcriptional regulator [Granulicella cerasi]
MNVMEPSQAALLPVSVSEGVLSTRMESTPMAPAKQNKHEMKTKETRELLLRAAREIFVRDGYEKADLAEIAKLAGRTKGAIYAQFKNKEEIFIALVEAAALERRARMRAQLAKSDSVAGNVAAMREHYIHMVDDDTFGLLLLEFRLYTIRHPDVRARLAQLYKSIIPDNEETVYTAMLGSPGKGKHALPRTVSIHTVFALMYALQVEMKFDPHLFDPKISKIIAARIFDAVFDPPIGQ